MQYYYIEKCIFYLQKYIEKCMNQHWKYIEKCIRAVSDDVKSINLGTVYESVFAIIYMPVKSEKVLKCSQLKMIGNTVFWGKHLFYTVFLISILFPPKSHTVYLAWIVTGTVFLVWIKGSIPWKTILTKEKYSIYEHSCCNYCNFWKQTPLMFF